MVKLAFVDVDTQFDFLNPKGNLYVSGAVEIIPNLKKLIEAAQKYHVPIVGSVDSHSPDDSEFKKFPPHCVKGTPGQQKIPETVIEGMRIISVDTPTDMVDLSPPGPVILEKRVYSLFDNLHAEAALRATGAKKFAVFGVATDYCVGAAVRGLLERGYETLLIADAVRAVDLAGGEKAMRELSGKGARLISTAAVIAEVAV